MSAKVKSMIQGVAVLACNALVCGLLLGAVNHFTYVDPFKSTLDGFKEDSGAAGEFEMLISEDTPVDGSSGIIKYYALSTDGVHAFLASATSQYGEVQLYVYIRDGQIYKIVLGSCTDDFSSDLTKGSFFEQFYGTDLSALDPLTADNVSNATYSSTAAKNAIDAVAKYYNENLAGGER